PQGSFGFRQGAFLGLIGHLFLLMVAIQPEWSLPPWPLFGALAVLTLAASATSLAVGGSRLHTAGSIAAAIVLFAWAEASQQEIYGWTTLIAAEAVAAYALIWMFVFVRAGRESLVP